jgi:hypothetical protein
MALMQPKMYLHQPSGVHQPTMNPNNAAQVVFGVRSKPPINFNVTLHQHAVGFGLKVHNIGYHPHVSGAKLSVTVSGGLDRARAFGNSAVSKFGTYLHSAELRFANQADKSF